MGNHPTPELMKKSILYRAFGIGKIPKHLLQIIEEEGIVLIDEGISGSVVFRNFRAPGRRHGYCKKWFIGSIVLTRKHILTFQFSKQIIGVPLECVGFV